MRPDILFGILLAFVSSDSFAQPDSSFFEEAVPVSTIKATLPKLPYSPALPADSSGKDTIGRFKKLSGKVKDHVHGSLKLEYLYREGNYPGQEKPGHTFRYSLSPSIRLGNIPFRFNVGYSSDYKGLNNHLYRLSFELDINQLKQELLKQGVERLQNELRKNDSLKKYITTCLDSLPDYDSLYLALKNLKLSRDSLLNLPDSLALPGSPDVQDSISARITSLEKLLEDIKSYRLKLAEIQQKRAEAEETWNGLRQTKRPQLNLLKNPFSGFRQLQIGSISLNYGRLLSSGSQFFGVNTEYEIRRIGLIGFAGSQLQRPSFLPEKDKPAPGSRFHFQGVGLRFGSYEGSYIRAIYTKGKTKERQEKLPVTDISFPDENSIWQVSGQLQLFKKHRLYAEWARSFTRGTIVQRSLPNENTIKKQEYGINSLLSSNTAVIAGLQGEYSVAKFSYDLSMMQTGSDYFSFANPYIRTDTRRLTLSTKKSLWRSNILWKSSLSTESDNVSGTKKATTSTERLSNSFQIKYRKLPTIQVGHTYFYQHSNSENMGFQTRAHVLNISVSQVKKWKNGLTDMMQLTWLGNTMSYQQSRQVFFHSVMLINTLVTKWGNVQYQFQAYNRNKEWYAQSHGADILFNVRKNLSVFGGGNYIIDKYMSNRVDTRAGARWQFYRNHSTSILCQYNYFPSTGNTFILGNLTYQVLW